MDSSLQILIGSTATFGGVVAYLKLFGRLGGTRAAAAGAGVAAGVAASFLLTLFLATIAMPAALGFIALVSGAAAYLTFRSDLGRKHAALAGAGAAVTVAASFLFVVYLAPIAFIGAIGVYHLVRTRRRIRAAMILMGTTFSGLLAAAALAFWFSLTYVM